MICNGKPGEMLMREYTRRKGRSMRKESPAATESESPIGQQHHSTVSSAHIRCCSTRKPCFWQGALVACRLHWCQAQEEMMKSAASRSRDVIVVSIP
jgi:hypothetical protein